jgi:hypothetical protein
MAEQRPQPSVTTGAHAGGPSATRSSKRGEQRLPRAHHMVSLARESLRRRDDEVELRLGF